MVSVKQPLQKVTWLQENLHFSVNLVALLQDNIKKPFGELKAGVCDELKRVAPEFAYADTTLGKLFHVQSGSSANF